MEINAAVLSRRAELHLQAAQSVRLDDPHAVRERCRRVLRAPWQGRLRRQPVGWHAGGLCRVWITGCDGFRLENVEVTNGGPINGFKIVDCTDFQLDSCRAHHFTYSKSPDPTDDVIQGYHFVRCKRFTVDKCYAHDLIGYISGSLIARYSRGFAFGDCESGTFNGLKIWNVDRAWTPRGRTATGSSSSTAATATIAIRRRSRRRMRAST